MEANHGAGHATTARPDSRVSPGPLRHPDLNTAPVAGGGSVRTVRRRGCAQRVPPRADRAADRGAGHQDRRHGAVATADKRNDAGAMAAIRRRAQEPADQPPAVDRTAGPAREVDRCQPGGGDRI
jgi:hypothetical protein